MQQVLKTRSIEFEMIDICAPGMQEMRKFMREKARKAEGQRNVVPPQVFNGEEYRGVGVHLINGKYLIIKKENARILKHLMWPMKMMILKSF